jgi:hypothetical protein
VDVADTPPIPHTASKRGHALPFIFAKILKKRRPKAPFQS